MHQLATTADYLSVLRGHPTKFRPGKRFEYCNGGFVILALVAEAVAQTSFYELASTRVFEPARMTSAGYLRMDQLPGSAAIGYLPAENGWRTNHFHVPIRGSGDGGCFTTLADMERFWHALFGGKILPRYRVDEMVRPLSVVPEENMAWGSGFERIGIRRYSRGWMWGSLSARCTTLRPRSSTRSFRIRRGGGLAVGQGVGPTYPAAVLGE